MQEKPAPDFDSTKIWRYMDLPKFVSMVKENALYFSCPSEFHDPYELYLTQNQSRGANDLMARLSGEHNNIVDQRLNQMSTEEAEEKRKQLKEHRAGYPDRVQNTLERSLKFYGVSCWHGSAYESEAMWKLYAVNGIAIESTVRKLKESLPVDRRDVQEVKYVDYDDVSAPEFEGFCLRKRKSFEHEKEVRARIVLVPSGKGQLVKCNLDTLISKIHVSPLASPYLKEGIKYILQNHSTLSKKEVIQSNLFEPRKV